jgi:hypothetical protein
LGYVEAFKINKLESKNFKKKVPVSTPYKQSYTGCLDLRLHAITI